MWNLDSLYISSFSEEFENDMKKIRELSELVLSYKESGQIDSKNEQRELYRDFYKVFNKAMSYCNLKNMDIPESHPEKSNLKSYLSDLRSIYLTVSKEVEETNEFFSALKPSSDKFTDSYYSSIRKYNSFKEESDISTSAFKELKENAAESLIGIKKNTLKLSEHEGYNSPLDKSLKLYQIPEKAFENMIDTIESLITHFKDYFKNSSYDEIYNLDSLNEEYDKRNKSSMTSLSYNMSIDSRLKESTISLGESKAIILKSLREFSEEAAGLAEKAFSSGWINTDPILKDPLCINIPSVSEFRIKLNYQEDIISLISIAHELGHGYHGSTLYGDDILNFKYPLSIGETSALFFEDLVYDYLFSKANAENNKENRAFEDMLKKHYISNIALFTMDVYARYLFESEIYGEIARSENITSDRISEIMKKSLLYVYGDIPNLNENLWIEKSHYYNFSRPYYNISYIFGLFIEKMLFRFYKNDHYPNFSELFTKFFSNTNKLSIEENMLVSFDSDVDNTTVWNDFYSMIIEYLNN